MIPYSRSMSSISSRNSCSAAIKSCISLAASCAARTTAAPRAFLMVCRTSHPSAVDSSARTSTGLSGARHNMQRGCASCKTYRVMHSLWSLAPQHSSVTALLVSARSKQMQHTSSSIIDSLLLTEHYTSTLSWTADIVPEPSWINRSCACCAST